MNTIKNKFKFIPQFTSNDFGWFGIWCYMPVGNVVKRLGRGKGQIDKAISTSTDAFIESLNRKGFSVHSEVHCYNVFS